MQAIRNVIFLICLLFLFVGRALAQQKELPISSDLYEWVENKGQWHPDIFFRCRQHALDLQIGKDFIRYRIQYSSTVPDHMFDLIYVEDMFVTRLSKLFGLEVRDVIPLVINWFNKTYDKNLNNNDWEWMDNEEDEEDF
jgi:hypothetical protein